MECRLSRKPPPAVWFAASVLAYCSWEGFLFCNWVCSVRDKGMDLLWLSEVGSVNLHRPSGEHRLWEQGPVSCVVIRTGRSFALAKVVVINPLYVNRFSDVCTDLGIVFIKAGCLCGTCDWCMGTAPKYVSLIAALSQNCHCQTLLCP